MGHSSEPATSAAAFLPAAPAGLAELRAAAAACQGCPLYRHATRTVFGEGPPDARLVLVGEQPGNEEDLSGRPFVGPAGHLLDRALAAAGIARGEVYLTNVVKHFKWTPQGKRRMHRKPGAREVAACLPWLEKELEIIAPEVLVCLGSTAAQALFGAEFRVSVSRGRPLFQRLAPHALATVHPSSVLRVRDPEQRHLEMERFTSDLRLAAAWLAGPRSA